MMADYKTPSDFEFAGVKSKRTNLLANADVEDENESKLSFFM
jgi:hypothetical protein